jgi:hypothetical protein
MVSGGDQGAATFELERFVWGAPDRLEISGTFSGVADPPADSPVLVVRGNGDTHRLPAVLDSVSGPPEDGRRWLAAFAWQEAPVAFDAAVLEFGDNFAVELPEPGARRQLFRHQVLEVRRPGAAAPDEEAVAAAPAEEPVAAAPSGAEPVRLEAELLAAQEELREAGAALQRAQAEVARAREDLTGERERTAADAERFRAGLARVQQSAADAIAAKDAELDAMRAQVAELDALRARVAELEAAGDEAGKLRSERERARGAADEARAQTEQLLGRLTAIRDALGD